MRFKKGDYIVFSRIRSGTVGTDDSEAPVGSSGEKSSEKHEGAWAPLPAARTGSALVLQEAAPYRRKGTVFSNQSS